MHLYENTPWDQLNVVMSGRPAWRVERDASGPHWVIGVDGAWRAVISEQITGFLIYMADGDRDFTVATAQEVEAWVSAHEEELDQLTSLQEEFKAASTSPLRVSRTDDKAVAEAIMGPEVLAFLEEMVEASPRIFPAGHPEDRDRWFRFLVTYHRSGRRRMADYELSRWLQAARGWNYDDASTLSAWFIAEMDLLDFIDDLGSGDRQL